MKLQIEGYIDKTALTAPEEDVFGYPRGFLEFGLEIVQVCETKDDRRITVTIEISDD